MIRWLLGLGVKLGVVEYTPKVVSQGADYRPVCPTCKSVMKFVWAKTDEFGQPQEEVGAWLCRCKKVPVQAMAVSGVYEGPLR